MLDLLTDLMEVVPSSCAYADARFVAHRAEGLRVRDGRLDRVEDTRSEGVGVRVRLGASWGFAATVDATADGLRSALARAIAVAEAQPHADVAWPAPDAPPAQGTWHSPAAVDPFSVSVEDKLSLLTAAESALHSDPRVVRGDAECLTTSTEKLFASSEGAACAQTFTECGGGIAAVAVEGEGLQVRSYPGSHGGHVAAAGWEHVLELDLPGHAPRVGEEAAALLTAPPCPSGPTTLVLHHEQLALQLHESIGHALELDRILLGEASYAGTSWVGVPDIGALRYGSELLQVTADATLPGGLGSFAWDDEGTPGQRTTLIDRGVLRSTLSDRVSAHAAGAGASGGCARADGFARLPIVRMTNVSLEPGEAGTLGDLLADTGDGIYLETNHSWSIDDRRLHFQFGTEVAREIRGGELGRLYRDASYAGVTPTFWSSLDAVCSAPAWEVWGLTNCGKGEPGQLAHVSHGAAPARFRGVEVGVA